MRSSYAKGAVLVLSLLVLTVEGYVGYQWYQRYHGAPADTGAVVPSSTGEVARTEETKAEDYGRARLLHRATPRNIASNSTYVDHPAANVNPDAVLLVAQVRPPNGRPASAPPMGVWYDENRGGRWAIFNQDLAPMPEGTAFDVVVLEGAGRDAFVHRATPDNTDGGTTYVDHPSVNAKPDAALSITANWNPGGGPGVYDNHPVEVRYDAIAQRWTIRNEDLAPIPDRAAFNVLVLRGDGG